MNKEQSQNQPQFQNQGKKQPQGNAQSLKDKIRQTWGKLNEDEIECYQDQRNAFLNAVQNKYGVSRDQAETTLRNLERQNREAA